jgi:hypothetical protein
MCIDALYRVSDQHAEGAKIPQVHLDVDVAPLAKGSVPDLSWRCTLAGDIWLVGALRVQ